MQKLWEKIIAALSCEYIQIMSMFCLIISILSIQLHTSSCDKSRDLSVMKILEKSDRFLPQCPYPKSDFENHQMGALSRLFSRCDCSPKD